MGWRSQVALVTVTSAVGGGLVSAIGPSIDAFHNSTGLDQAQLGSAVMFSRLVKMLGLLLWTTYAQALQRGNAWVSPRVVMAWTMAATTCVALLLATVRNSAYLLRLLLALFGLCYGVFDAGSMQLALWCSESKDTKRTALAAVCAGYGSMGTLTPTLVAVSLKLGGNAYTSFYALAALAATVCLLYIGSPPLPVEPVHGYSVLPADGVELSPKAEPFRTPRRAQRDRFIYSAMGTVLFCICGTEHAVATWLPTFGAHVGGIDAATMAFATAVFWGTIALGRVFYSAISAQLRSGWPVLFLNISLVLCSSVLYLLFSSPHSAAAHGADARHGAAPGHDRLNPTWLVWLGTAGIGVGVASAYPCAITLPEEASIKVTPAMMLGYNLFGTAGEMAGPVVVGWCFGQGRYSALGEWSCLLAGTALTVSLIAFNVAPPLPTGDKDRP